MRDLLQAVLYLIIVFAVGFALAFIRIPFLVPNYVVRTAKLMETPVMLLEIDSTSRWIQRRNGDLLSVRLLSIGGIGFVLMIVAELALAVATSDLSPSSFVLPKDPVSEPGYLLSLVVFALAKWLWSFRVRV